MNGTFKRIVVLITTMALITIPCMTCFAQEIERDDAVIAGQMAGDALVARPLGLCATVIGGALFVVSLPFSLLGGNTGDAFNYLLTLRLIPAFPLLIVNIAAGLMNVRAKTFILASLLGMIPSSFVYAGIGAGLGHIFAKGGPVTLETLFSPRIYLPIIGMGVLAFLPPLWRHWRNGRLSAPLDEK